MFYVAAKNCINCSSNSNFRAAAAAATATVLQQLFYNYQDFDLHEK
jgi:hypothetical protein